MKKFIICFILVISIMLGLCACHPTVVDDQGVERTMLNGFVIIHEQGRTGSCTFVVYHQVTKVVYYLESDSYNGFLSPYIIYQDGALYGAIFQDGEIVPVPYAYAPLE